MPDPNTPWHPEAFAALGMAAVARAFWLDQARHQTAMLAVHSQPAGLTDEQLLQRRTILTIATKMLEVERDKAMDTAVDEWIAYRRHA